MRFLPPTQSAADAHGSENDHTTVGAGSPSPDVETETDAEVDQLDSDSDIEGTESGSSDGQTGAIRLPGHSLLPTERLENILQADGVTGTLALSKEALFVLSVATEEFIKRMATTGHIHANAQRRNVVSYVDMAASTQQYQEFMFLKDTIPAPISIAKAMQLRQAKEKEVIEDDPALAKHHFVRIPYQKDVTPSKPKEKGRTAVNGHEQTNGNAPSAARSQEQYYNPANGFLLNPSWSNASNGNIAIPSGNMLPFVNGDMPPHPVFLAQDSYDGHSGHVSPHAYYPPSNNTPDRPDDTWLSGPGLVDPSDNLGRTIYTKDRG